MDKKFIVYGVVIIIIFAVLAYNFYPRAQEVIIEFEDGGQHTVGSLFSVSYGGKSIERVIVKVNDEEALDTFTIMFESPLGNIIPLQTSTNTWSVEKEQLLDYSLDEGKYTIKMVSSIGEISFDLTLKDNRGLVIIFG